MTKPDSKGWELFESCFKQGDEVVVIDVFDHFWWGRLERIYDVGCVLYRYGTLSKTLEWDDVRFMAHDGFPVRKLIGADGSRTIERIVTTDTQRMIREALEHEFPNEIHKPLRARFGDPFDAECVSARLYHPGNSGRGYWDRFWDPVRRLYRSDAHREAGYEREEVLVMESGDGAMAELWDLTTVYMFEAAS